MNTIKNYDVIELSKMKFDELETLALELGIDNSVEIMGKQPLIYAILDKQSEEKN